MNYKTNEHLFLKKYGINLIYIYISLNRFESLSELEFIDNYR